MKRQVALDGGEGLYLGTEELMDGRKLVDCGVKTDSMLRIVRRPTSSKGDALAVSLTVQDKRPRSQDIDDEEEHQLRKKPRLSATNKQTSHSPTTTTTTTTTSSSTTTTTMTTSASNPVNASQCQVMQSQEPEEYSQWNFRLQTMMMLIRRKMTRISKRVSSVIRTD